MSQSNRIRQVRSSLVNALSSKWLSNLIIIVLIGQSLWVAATFSWIIFDERFHFGLVNIYTDHWWPVIYNQPVEYDIYRDLASEGSKLYHYLLSYPLRLIELFTDDTVVQLRALRVLNVGFIAVGLVYFYRLFDLMKIRRLYSNVAILAFVFLPIVPWLGGTLNYDNFLFMLTPIFLILTIRQYRTPTSIANLILLVVIGLLASLSKFTFLPIFFIGIVIVLYRLWVGKLWPKIAWNELKRPFSIFAGAVMIVLSVLFVQTYVINVIEYGTPRPSCQATLGVDRCLANSVVSRNENLKVAKEGIERKSAPLYFYDWSHEMHRKLFYSYSTEEKPPLQGILWSYSVMAAIGTLSLVAVLYSRKNQLKPELRLLLLITVLYTGIVFFEHYKIYQEYAIPLAVQGRYLLLLLPIIIVSMVISVHVVLKDKFGVGTTGYNAVVMLLFLTLFAGLLQGGGALTHIKSMEPANYWPGTSQSINASLHDILDGLILE